MPTQTRYIKATAGGSTPLNTADIFKTGATTSYQTNDDGGLEIGRGSDFTTLDFNNGFGSNTNRFTDDVGNQTYSTNIVVDWSTWNQVDEKVLAYYRTPNSSTNLTNQLSGQPYTVNSLGSWYVCNYKQLVNVMNLQIARNYLNYSPFNFDYAGSSANRLWCSTRESASIGIFLGNTSFTVGNHSGNYKAILCRTYTLTELGL